jgi:molecular chaperone GrpE (heat shock protein)
MGGGAVTIDDWRARYDHLNAETDRLRAEVERLRADAKRYGYIRSLGRVTVADVSMEGVHYHLRFMQTFVRAQLEDIATEQERFDAGVDAAIDAARGKK